MRARSSLHLPFLLLGLALLAGALSGSAVAHPPDPDAEVVGLNAVVPSGAATACDNSYSVGGVPLDQCYPLEFQVDGNDRSVSVHYTLDQAHNGSPHDHYILHVNQARGVAHYARDAWWRYYEDAGVEPYIDGCGGNIDILLEEGDSWSGIAYFAIPGRCKIGIDAIMVREGGEWSGRGTTYHEMQHYVQFAYESCADDLNAEYPANSDFVEGYADYGPSTVDNSGWYDGNVYDASESMYAKAYDNRFVIYLSEQVSESLGPNGSPGDAWYRSNGMYHHYRQCEDAGELYVEEELVEANTPYSYKAFFMNFIAANWAKDWADVGTQPELHYYEEDVGISLAAPSLAADVSLGGGSQSWPGQTVPDRWAGIYYQVRPQAGCPYLLFEVEGEPHGELGIDFMAANTGAPSVVRSSSRGVDFARAFAAHGVHDKLVAAVSAFVYSYDFDLKATCVTPTLEILEPGFTNPSMVGEPAAPIAFLSRFKVMSGSDPVRGMVEGDFTFAAEGDPVDVAPGTLLEIGGGEYWATLLPPSKPPGTTFIDLEVCLGSTACATEQDGLLYVDPGHTDTIILHDESGSMGIEDVIGEGTRLENAQKAAMVWANLARTDDRFGVMGLNALDNPHNCCLGCPGGTGDCELDIRTHLSVTEITSPSVQIPAIEAAITGTQALVYTPIGQGLLDAKDSLLSVTSSENRRSVVLLSDGKQNVRPLYGGSSSTVQQDMIDSGVVVNTIGFSGDSPSALLSAIAANTGGVFRDVPSEPGSSASLASSSRGSDAYVERLTARGIEAQQAADLVAALTTSAAYYHPSVALADVYDLYDAASRGATRVAGEMYADVTDNTWQTVALNVDPTVTMLRLVSAGRQADGELDDPSGCDIYRRKVEVLPPPGTGEWIPVSPPGGPARPPSWDIRNSEYVDVVLVPRPDAGPWQVRTRYYYVPCPMASGDRDESLSPGSHTHPTDFLINASVQSTLRLEGRFRSPFEDNQGRVGEHVPIVAALMHQRGTLAGANDVTAAIDRPGSVTDLITLHDDGNHGDGTADDGIYGASYPRTTAGGAYNVTIVATFEDPSKPGRMLQRQWLGGFTIEGPGPDEDDDGMAAHWEAQYDCLDPKAYDDPHGDWDGDGADHWTEYYNGTHPCDADTDDGGENDGSEIANQRDPFYAEDDLVLPVRHVSVRPLNGAIMVRWSRPQSYTRMLMHVHSAVERQAMPAAALDDPIDLGTSGVYTHPLPNGERVVVQLQGVVEDEGKVFRGGPTSPLSVMPKADPDAPSGFVMINDGAPRTHSRRVTLRARASDVPLDGLPCPNSAATVAHAWSDLNEVSGAVEMRFSNHPAEGWTAWETLAPTRTWQMDCGFGQRCRVYGQFRDGALNDSLVVSDDIVLFKAEVYLPLVMRH